MLYLLNPFQGQIGRGRWWLLQLAIFGMAFAGLYVSVMLFADPDAPASSRNSSENIMLWTIIIVMIYMNFSTCQNRLRDTDRSGAWYAAFLLPTVGTALMIYFCGIEAGEGGDQPQKTSTTPTPQNYAPSAQARVQAFGRR